MELELLELELLELTVEEDFAVAVALEDDEEPDEVAEVAAEVEAERVLVALPGPVIEPVGLTKPVSPRPSKE